MSLTFDPAAHAYAWSGRPVPSVTQVIGEANDLSMVPRETLDRKTEIGVALHSALSLYWRDDLDPDSVDPTVRPYLDGIIDWIDRAVTMDGFVIHGFETPLYSPRFGFAGTPDFWGEYRDGFLVADPKTVAGKIGPHVGLQLAAYRQLLVEAFGEQWRAAHMYALHLDPDGRCKPVAMTEPAAWSVFAGALSWWKWRRKHGLI